MLADLGGPGLESLGTALRAEGHEIETRPVDVGDRASVAALGRYCGGLGRVVSVVHTAGVSPAQASAERILRVDLLGVAHMIDEFGSVIAPGAAAVVIASMAGHRMLSRLSPEQEQALGRTPAEELLDLPFVRSTVDSAREAYWMAKRGDQLQVQAAAAVWAARGARINSISPGVVATPMGAAELAGPRADQVRAAIAGSPAGRIASPDDIPAAAAFLLGPEALYITGTDLLVDGGGTARRARASAGA